MNRNNNNMKVFMIALLLMGTFFIGIGLYINSYAKDFKKNNNKTIATIEKIDEHFGGQEYDVYVSYTIDGNKFIGKLSYDNSNAKNYHNSYITGDKIDIYYDKDDPTNITSNFPGMIGYIFILLGGIIIICAIIMVVKYINKTKKNKEIVKYDYIVTANINSININTSIAINGRNPYIVTASYIDPNDGKVYTFKSDNIWRDVHSIIQQTNISTIPVYVNPNNIHEYYVDICYFDKFKI